MQCLFVTMTTTLKFCKSPSRNTLACCIFSTMNGRPSSPNSAVRLKSCAKVMILYISINTWCFIITVLLNTKQNWDPGSCFKPGLIPRIWSTTEFTYGLRWLKEADPLSCPIMSSLNWLMAPTPFMSWLASVKSIKGPRGNFLCQSRHATRKDINLCPFS